MSSVLALHARVRSPHALPQLLSHAVTAAELLQRLTELPEGRHAGGSSDGIAGSVLVSGIEYACATEVEERSLRAAWKRRERGGATPLVLVSDDPDSEQAGFVRVLGPQRDGPLCRVRTESLLAVVRRTLSMARVHAARLVAEELDCLDIERVAGLRVRGLGTEHLYREQLRHHSPRRWQELHSLTEGVSRAGWRELLSDLGYTIEQLKPSGYLARFEGQPVVVAFPRAQTWMFARLDNDGRPPESALIERCRRLGAPYGILASGTRLRLLAAGKGEAGAATSYVELDAAALEPDRRPLLGLLSPAYLAQGGLREVLVEARDQPRAVER
jgi:hypothetical protein